MPGGGKKWIYMDAVAWITPTTLGNANGEATPFTGGLQIFIYLGIYKIQALTTGPSILWD